MLCKGLSHLRTVERAETCGAQTIEKGILLKSPRQKVENNLHWHFSFSLQLLLSYEQLNW